MSSFDILDGKIIEIETNVVIWYGGLDLNVIHLNGLDLSGGVHGYESDNHAGLRGTVLDTAEGLCANTAFLVDVLEEVFNLVDVLAG